MYRIQRALLLAGLAVVVISACSDSESDRPIEGTTPTVSNAQPALEDDATPTRPPALWVTPEAEARAEILTAVEAYSAEQGWNLVGLCFSEAGQSATPGSYCRFEPWISEEDITIQVGLVQSDFIYTLTLRRLQDGGLAAVDRVLNEDPP